MTAPHVQTRAQAWAARDPDPETRGAVERLIAAERWDELTELFSGRLAFGTAGLRAPMGPGPARMNRLVVRESAAGIARHLLAVGPDARERGVVVGCDARRNSERFADDVAEVVAAHGIPVVLGQRPLPTPVLVHAVARRHACAGIVITASHNPAPDNGLKLYLDDAAQIAPPVDQQVAAMIDAVAADGRIVPSGPPAAIEPLEDRLVDDYVTAIRARVPGCRSPIGIAVTAMHGVGGDLLLRALGESGFAEVVAVAAQHRPDARFPTAPFPNPEEPGATDLLARTMEEQGSSLGLALDPDADRVAVLVAPPEGGSARQLTGDEVGCLLAEWLLAEVETEGERLLVNTVVSSQLPAAIAAHHGIDHVATLTGFKWLCRPALADRSRRQVLAYEEALGYAVGPVRDKDGIGAALAVAAMASSLAAAGRGLLDLLDELHLRHGVHLTENVSWRDDAPGAQQRQSDAVAHLENDPPRSVAGRRVEEAAWAGPGVLRLRLEGGLRVLLRPSGTEPKLKCYCEVVRPVGSRAELPTAREAARADLVAARDRLAALMA